ncbi:MAG: tetratricopeptide repeat protein, partial [Bacteroidales bacterium]
MKKIIILSLMAIVMMGALNAQDTIKIRTGDSQIAEQNYNEGVKLLQNGDLQNAISKFTDAIQLKPDLAKAYYNRGVAKSE